ncbi:MAG: hypothetical protein KHZ15_02670 [Coprobacillus cateniformis]|uniref:hypothetical protein n=1 Tax=Longibaculum muris TaxID=1796628 RepID=UPI003AB20C00|nr:hypothetical protein [Coprobacillus cateniformis]
MDNIVIVVTIVNLIYFVIWIGINKLRNSNITFIKDWDNGNDFYESLSENDKKIYWKQDTHILNIVLLIFFPFMNLALFLIDNKNDYWIICLVTGLILSCILGVLMSIQLRKRLK